MKRFILALALLFAAGPALAQSGGGVFSPPVFGVATGSSLALGGCTISTDVLCFTGSVTGAGGNFVVGATGQTQFGTNGEWLATASVLQDNGNTAGPALVEGAASATAPSFRPRRSDAKAGIGADAAGDVSIIGDNAGTATEMVRVTGLLVSLPTIGSDATHTDANVCEDTTSHALYAGSGTAGICLGTSSIRFKQNVRYLTSGLETVMSLRPFAFNYRPGVGFDPAQRYYGLMAEDVVKALPDLARRDANGQPQSVDLLGLVPFLIKAVQEQQAQIAALRGEFKRQRR